MFQVKKKKLTKKELKEQADVINALAIAAIDHNSSFEDTQGFMTFSKFMGKENRKITPIPAKEVIFSFANVIKEIKRKEDKALKSPTESNAREFMMTGKKHSQTAFNIFKKITAEKSIALSPWIVLNRYRAGFVPDVLEFWEHPDAITDLYESLQKGA